MVNLIWLTLLGLLCGLLINYLADVVPVRRRLVQPFCLGCEKPISWVDYLLFKRCTQCGRNPSLRRAFVIGLAICASIRLWYYPSQRMGYWVGFVLLVYLAVVAVIDIEYRLILQPVSIFGAVLGLIIGTWIHSFWVTLFGGLAGFGIMFLLYYLGDVFARWLARRRGEELSEVALGYGDVILSGVLGFILGWPGVMAGLFLAILFGGVFSTLVIVKNVINRSYHPFMAIPYAPFLILGAMVLLYRP